MLCNHANAPLYRKPAKLTRATPSSANSAIEGARGVARMLTGPATVGHERSERVALPQGDRVNAVGSCVDIGVCPCQSLLKLIGLGLVVEERGGMHQRAH